MASLSHFDRIGPGLRERKKARTRAAIQQQALRLFREQGYEQTTIEQIAEAAEFSPSTFFRYFPAKEDVVMYDDLDPLLIEAFQAQPPELTPVQAMRRAVRAVFAELPPDQMQDMRERFNLMSGIPELRARILGEFIRNIQLVAEMIAARTGRSPSDFEVRSLAGALIGVMLPVLLEAMENRDADLPALMDAALAHMEAGLPL